MATDKDNKAANPGPGKGEQKGAAKGAGKGGKAPSPKKHAAESAEPTGPKVPARLRVRFQDAVRPKLAEKFGLKNPMAQPKVEKIVVNINLGRHIEGTKLPPEKRQTAIDTIVAITGQKPIVVKAKKSVSNFKLRAGFESSVMVTLRRDRMWHFLDRLINLATPRIKDFRGVSTTAFDRRGNYSLGVNEQGVFPEINMAEVNFTHGMNINVVFRNSNPERSRFVLEELGMPFAKPEERKSKAAS
jgi:large subunit ribosomal protein L5